VFILKRYNKIGKFLFYIGILLSAVGFSFNQSIGIADTPDPYATLSIPFIVIGIILLVVSNFYKKSKENN
jgi:glycopeptide antibiotics resistance protein